MSNLYESIPPAVATIVAAVTPRLGTGNSEPERAAVLKLVVELTDQLARTFARALDDAQKLQP